MYEQRGFWSFCAQIKSGIVKSPSISDYNLELLRLTRVASLHIAAVDKRDRINVFHVIVMGIFWL